ncbi:MAG TPA: phosphoribosylglycinamide formyltransferase [Bacteroidetes bacterium]|nr:phosphoribosylglycinamide formyltransferase [Bacteroidota bacterium]
MLQVAVLGSGRGSNFQAILDAIQRGTVPNVRVRVVISNNLSAGILEIARAHTIPAVNMSQRQFPDESTFVDTLLGTFRQHEVNFIVLAGYMKRLHPRIIAAFRNRIINIHPALLPKYGGEGMYGMHVHEAVVAHKEVVSGATVHIVDEEFDHGAVILQKRVAIDLGDTAEIVAAKVLKIEHEIYPQALRLFAEGAVTLTRNTVVTH